MNEWTEYQEDADGNAIGVPFGDHLSERIEKFVAGSAEPEPEPKKPGIRDAWLTSGERSRQVNKSRGALFADLIVNEEMMVDIMMRRND